jgi:hypothetical protein
VPSVKRVPTRRRRVEEDADFAGDEELPRCVESDELHAAFGHEAAQQRQRLQPLLVVERDLRAGRIEHRHALLREDRLEQPRIGPFVNVVGHACNARRFVDLLRQCDDTFPRVRHVPGIAAGLFDELRVEVHHRKRRIHRETVELAVHLAEVDDLAGVVVGAPLRRLGREQRIEREYLMSRGEHIGQLRQQMESGEVDVRQVVGDGLPQHRLVSDVVVGGGRAERDLDVGVRLHEGLRDGLVIPRERRLRVEHIQRHALRTRGAGRNARREQRRREPEHQPGQNLHRRFLLDGVAVRMHGPRARRRAISMHGTRISAMIKQSLEA